MGFLFAIQTSPPPHLSPSLSPSLSDLDTMHKDLAALIQGQSKKAKAAGKKQKEDSKRDLEEKAIKLGKMLRGEVCVCEDPLISGHE